MLQNILNSSPCYSFKYHKDVYSQIPQVFLMCLVSQSPLLFTKLHYPSIGHLQLCPALTLHSQIFLSSQSWDHDSISSNTAFITFSCPRTYVPHQECPSPSHLSHDLSIRFFSPVGSLSQTRAFPAWGPWVILLPKRFVCCPIF